MTAEEIRQHLHRLIDALPAEELVRLEQDIEKHEQALQRRQLIAHIIEEDARLLKRLGR
ncbi:hypothetical protein [Cesiribacter sp. SM1]|uniref:hypothetical protein n=1 Tax=Cesiribacter sp. SM1 TaxID=2861196 RepID=UPI001CD671AC|nr:hypothetical protein [Cesiribacter sp. SM1]